MNSKKITILIYLTIFVSFVRADEILLKEGKTLQGKITKEDDIEYTILLGRNMYLRVPKTAVAQVNRTEKKEEGPRVIRYINVSKPHVSTATSPAPSKGSPKPPDILNIKMETRESQREKNGISIFEVVIYKPYNVVGSDFAELKDRITDPENGVGILMGRKRQPSTTTWDPVWDGQQGSEEGKFKWTSGVVRATITVTVPHWKASETPPPASVEEWNRFISNINSLESGRIGLYTRSLDHLAESMSHVSASTEKELISESKKLFETMLKRAEKRQQGYLRRASDRLPSPKKSE